MGSDETMGTPCSDMQEDEYYSDIGEDGYNPHHPADLPHNLSRLSMRAVNDCYHDGEDGGMGVGMYMESDGDADQEFSDYKEGKDVELLSSDSENEPGCYSLPATPPRRRFKRGYSKRQQLMRGAVKDYASENEADQKTTVSMSSSKNPRRRRSLRERNWDHHYDYNCNHSLSGESESGGGGVVVITRPKGGRRSLCMDLEEVKACRDLGFELEHERMLEMHSRLSISHVDTSSDGNSPIASWRISTPGDDPRDVKARLKVWAQAVALASTSRQAS